MKRAWVLTLAAIFVGVWIPALFLLGRQEEPEGAGTDGPGGPDRGRSDGPQWRQSGRNDAFAGADERRNGGAEAAG